MTVAGTWMEDDERLWTWLTVLVGMVLDRSLVCSEGRGSVELNEARCSGSKR